MIYTLDAGDGGIASDLDGMDAADKLWMNGANVRFENGYLQPFDGHARVFEPPTVIPYGVFPHRLPTANIWVYPGLAKIYTVDDAGTHTNITRASGGDYSATAGTKWTGGALTAYLILNNENDVPQSWDGLVANDCVNLTAWTSTWRCKAIRPLRNYIVAVGITKGAATYPVMVKWSHAAAPGALPSSWDETDAAVDAAEQDIGDAGGALIDVVPLGDLGIIYSTGSYHSMQYIGGTYVWRFARLPDSNIGALSQNCATQYPGGHVVLSGGDVVSHAGGAPTSIIDARMRKSLFNTMDGTYFARSFVVHDELKSEVWICIPESAQTSCTLAYVWNYAQNSWGKRDLPNVAHANLGPVVVTAADTWADGSDTWETDAGPWDGATVEANRRRVMMASVNTHLYLADSGVSYDGSTPVMYVERTGLSLGDPNKMKFVKSVRPRIDAIVGTAVNVRVGSAMKADGTVTWSDAVTYTVGTSIAAHFRVVGRFIGIKLESTAGAIWRCRSMDIEYENVGQV